jgi:integrase
MPSGSITVTPDQLQALVAAAVDRVLDTARQPVSVDQARRDGNDARQLPENPIADDRGSSIDTEEPMYSWISPKPYAQHQRFRVWVKNLDGAKAYETFPTEAAAVAFIERAQRKLLNGGHPIEDTISNYLEAKSSSVKPSTIETLRHRLRAVIEDRQRFPIEGFPWAKAWQEHVAPQSANSQYGIRSALDGLIAWAVRAGLLRRAPDLPKPTGTKKRGKAMLRKDETRTFIQVALAASDPLAIAGVTMILTGIRPGEAMTLKVRDLDDGGSLLWVAADGGKTEAATRRVEVDDVLKPYLLALAQGRDPNALLFAFEAQRRRKSANAYKSRRDALLRRVKALCEEAKVPAVVAHSMRGLHATLATEAGVSGHAVAANLGHTTFVVTGSALRRARDRSRGSVAEVARRSANTRTAVTRTASRFTATGN